MKLGVSDINSFETHFFVLPVNAIESKNLFVLWSSILEQFDLLLYNEGSISVSP